MKISIVIPVYNEKDTILEVIQKVKSSVENLDALVDAYEIIIVDDGSVDETPHLIEEHYSSDSRIRFFIQPENKGKGAAITKGFSLTTGDVVLVQDADLEYDPREYGILLNPIKEGKADVVYGSRFKGETTRVLYFWHYVGNKFLTLLSNMFTNLNLTDMETCYKVFRGDIIRSMKLESQRFGIEPEMTAKISKIDDIRIYEVPISYYGRTYAEGKKIGWKDGFAAIWYIVKFNVFKNFQQSFKETNNLMQG